MWPTIIIIILAAIYIFLEHIYSYWPRNGFDHITPIIPFGNLNSVRRREKSFGIAIYDLYLLTKRPIIGIYLFFRPALLIRNPDIIKDMLTKSFHNFHDRGIYVDDNDPSSQNLFALQGQKWKQLRSKLTPIFTSGKLKNMFETITITGKSMQQYLDDTIGDNDCKIVEMKDVITRYAVDIIGSTIFGISVNSFKDPQNEFFQMREKLNNPGFMSNLRATAVFLCPRLIKVFKFLRIPDPFADNVNSLMIEIVKQTIEFREKNNITRKDLMQSLIQLRNTGKINPDDDEIWNIETAAENLKSMSIEQCAAQCSIFYIAGLETSSSTTAFCLYELTQNEDVLIKLQDDIKSALDKHNGEITYDSIKDMKYLDLCIKETLRKYPGLPILNRECTEDYVVPNTDSIIKKGTAIIISTMGLHRDSNYFPEPLKFNPDRFNHDNENDFIESAYIPFGDGPRNCIGIRLGEMNAKMGIVMILTKFNIEAVEKKEMEFDNYSVGLIPKNGINIKISKKNI